MVGLLQGDTALMIAARHGHLHIVKELLSSGADITVTDAEVSSNIYICRLCGKASLGAVRAALQLHTPAALHAVSAAVIAGSSQVCVKFLHIVKKFCVVSMLAW